MVSWPVLNVHVCIVTSEAVFLHLLKKHIGISLTILE